MIENYAACTGLIKGMRCGGIVDYFKSGEGAWLNYLSAHTMCRSCGSVVTIRSAHRVSEPAELGETTVQAEDAVASQEL